MKNSFLILIGFSLMSFSCAWADTRKADKKNDEASKPGLVDYREMPRVGIVRKIDVVIQQAIREGWSKEEWVKRFGSPQRKNSYKDNLELIQYYETGPFKDASKELITGVTIKLRRDKTFDYSYRTTSFGLPDYIK